MTLKHPVIRTCKCGCGRTFTVTDSKSLRRRYLDNRHTARANYLRRKAQAQRDATAAEVTP